MIKGVIFDMDGVLVDNRELHIRSFEAWCVSRNFPFSATELAQCFGMGNREIFPFLLHDNTLTAEQCAIYGEEKEAIYRQMADSEIEPLAGLVDLLTNLKNRGIKIAVGSSGMRKNVDMVLKKCKIARFFDVIANGDMVERAKPAPDIFLLAAKLMGLEPSECFVFEDSIAGIKAARSAGMRLGAVATTLPRSQHDNYDIIVDNFVGLTYDSLNSVN